MANTCGAVGFESVLEKGRKRSRREVTTIPREVANPDFFATPCCKFEFKNEQLRLVCSRKVTPLSPNFQLPCAVPQILLHDFNFHVLSFI